MLLLGGEEGDRLGRAVYAIERRRLRLRVVTTALHRSLTHILHTASLTRRDRFAHLRLIDRNRAGDQIAENRIDRLEGRFSVGVDRKL